ncbi:MAG: asparaginase domain-containing protein [Xanthomonadales bacterium]|nr:asparaginase domain-containing protein [Xanthomonadales bacterium]
MDHLIVITTGGTIDKVYFDDLSDFKVGDPQIIRVFEQMNISFRWEVRQLMRKDSLQLNDADRQLIRDTILTSDAKHFLITHGTDSMVQTAAALADLDDRVIILTGALNPASFIGSDAMFNIGSAITAVQILPPGVYITMNGQIFDHDKVSKDVAQGRFVSH